MFKPVAQGDLMHKRKLLIVSAVAVAIAIAGCGSNSGSKSGVTTSGKATPPEASPAGDIPDNQAFVAYAPAGAGYSVKVPEGWARTNSRGAVAFTDKLNSVSVRAIPATAPLTPAEAKSKVVSQLKRSNPGFRLIGVSTVNRPAGKAVVIKYETVGQANSVTGKKTVKAVEQYYFFHAGKRLVLTLSGAKGADNVDPWKIVSSSVRWTR
jgi:hypothetical protein